MAHLDNNYEADYMDAMADRLADIEEALRETEPEQWEGYDDQA